MATQNKDAEIETAEKPNLTDFDHHEYIDNHRNAPLTSAFTDLPASKAIWTFRRLFLTGAAASLGATYIGYTGAAIGNIVANQGFIQQFGTVHDAKGDLQLDASHVSTWGAVQTASQIAFQLLSPAIIDRFGRKMAMYILTLNVLIAILIEIFAKDWQLFTVAKMFCGAAAGLLGPSVLTWMSEAALPQFRGVLLSCFALSLALGQFTNAIACQIVNTHIPMKYRHVFYSEFCYLGLWVAAVAYIPESAVWLITKGREDKAKKALRRLVGDKVQGYDLEHEFSVLVAEVRTSEENLRANSSGNDWKALFQWHNLKRCIAASIPFALQQFAGVPYIYNYTTYFFQLAGLADPFLGNTILNCIYVASIFASFFFVDKLGRRPVVLGGLGTLAVINFIIGGLGFTNSKTHGTTLTAMCSLWIFVYSLSLAPLGWVGIVEVSSIRLRAKTAAFGVLVNSFIGLVFNYTVPLLLSDQDAGWGQKIGLFFGGLSLLFFIPTYFMYPETKGRSYADIDQLYKLGISPRNFRSTKLDEVTPAVPGV